ncbi:hypothetical protein LTR37_013395 [Vermiconidia calcicola]|uniref:Uncharacterized protein n=1 Tax=Vermiconidia calcicola TaxID=1690605 RepID=A0ACC3MY27_9PEZI|nr:hypothetical protein LTR37_013395 [Vermiconidia calcicola]
MSRRDTETLTASDNYTYSIDLSVSWTNETAILNRISKDPAPSLNTEALWLDENDETFYAYGGCLSSALTYTLLPAAPPNELWQFTPSGKSGSWSTVQISPVSNFSILSRTSSATYGGGNGLGFALGGLINDKCDSDLLYEEEIEGEYRFNPPGMVVYNDTSEIWYNVSAEAISYYGTAVNGAAQFVPAFGPEGLLFLLGGRAAYAGEWSTYFVFDDIPIYEPVSQRWLTQKTSGDIPSPVENPCAVGVDGDDGTYEIFLYGGLAGTDIPNTVEMGAVYVLSLPSFHWQKQSRRPSHGRYRASCNIAGSGTRQMVVYGGQVVLPKFTALANDRSAADIYAAVDPWPQALGVFDLSAMEWSSSFDPNADPYITPAKVKAHIAANGPYPPSWSDSTVESWFLEKRTTSAPQPTESGKPDSDSTNTGAIAGGVVGGVAVLVIIGLAIWFLRRKRRRDQNNMSPESQRAELEYHHPPQEVSAAEKRYDPVEMDNGARSELDGGWYGHEVRETIGPPIRRS